MTAGEYKTTACRLAADFIVMIKAIYLWYLPNSRQRRIPPNAEMQPWTIPKPQSCARAAGEAAGAAYEPFECPSSRKSSTILRHDSAARRA